MKRKASPLLLSVACGLNTKKIVACLAAYRLRKERNVPLQWRSALADASCADLVPPPPVLDLIFLAMPLLRVD